MQSEELKDFLVGKCGYESGARQLRVALCILCIELKLISPDQLESISDEQLIEYGFTQSETTLIKTQASILRQEKVRDSNELSQPSSSLFENNVQAEEQMLIDTSSRIQHPNINEEEEKDSFKLAREEKNSKTWSKSNVDAEMINFENRNKSLHEQKNFQINTNIRDQKKVSQLSNCSDQLMIEENPAIPTYSYSLFETYDDLSSEYKMRKIRLNEQQYQLLIRDISTQSETQVIGYYGHYQGCVQSACSFIEQNIDSFNIREIEEGIIVLRDTMSSKLALIFKTSTPDIYDFKKSADSGDLASTYI